MPRSPSGVATLPLNDSHPAAPRNVIRADDINAINGDIEAMMTDSLSRSGLGGMESNLDMGGFDVLNAPNLVERGSDLIAAIEEIIPLLPTTLPGSPNKLWNNGGLLSIS